MTTIIGCSDMGTGALKAVTKKLYDAIEGIPDTGSLGRDYLDSLQSLESSFARGLAVVRHLANAVRPVNRLPPEILAEIFSLIAESVALERMSPSTWELDLTQIRRLHALTTVCRCWHDVALGTRSLWPIIWYDPVHRGGIFHWQEPALMHTPYPLATDYSGPLSIYIAEPDPQEAKEILDQYGARTRELYLVMGQKMTRRDASPFFTALKTFPYYDALEHVAIKLGPHISPSKLSFLSGCAPRLRSLSLQMAHPCPAATLPALTHLVLSAPQHWWVRDVLKLLSCCPRLEHAHMLWSPIASIQRQLENSDSQFPERRIDLRHMRRLTLNFTFADEGLLALAIEVVLFTVMLPQCCHVYLVPHVEKRSLSEQAGARYVSSALRHWSVPTTTTADSKDGIPCARLDFYVGAELQLAHPRGSGSLTLKFPQVHAAAIVQETIRARAASEDTTAISPFTPAMKELWICAQLRGSSADLGGAMTLLNALPGLERLVVAGNPTTILQALARLRPGGSDDDASSVFCPELDMLSVFVCSHKDAEAVRKTLAARAHAGCPVRCLVMPGPLPGTEDPVTEADVETLRERVEELVVVDAAGWGRVTEVDWWTRRLREACAGNGDAALGRNLRCDWPTAEYLGWK